MCSVDMQQWAVRGHLRSSPLESVFFHETLPPTLSALLALMDFLELFRKQDALASGLPPHLQQSAIEVAQSAHNRHLFAGKMNLATTRISYPFRQSCSSHDGPPGSHRCT